MYRSGRHEEAVSPATRWSAERITLEIGRLLAEDARPDNAEEREVTRLAAVAILTESALIHVRKGDPGLLAPGLWAAHRVLEAEPLGARGRSFGRRFYLLAGLILHWHVEFAVGHRLLVEALQHFPDEPELLTAAGSIIETVAAIPTTAVLALDRSASVSGEKLPLLRAAARRRARLSHGVDAPARQEYVLPSSGAGTQSAPESPR